MGSRCRHFPCRKPARFIVMAVLVVIIFLLLRCFRAPRYSLGFGVKLTDKELASLLDTVDVFTRVLTDASIPFFMYGGTLIGSWRHHGLIPWDDDVDFILPYALKDKAQKVLGHVEPYFILNTDQGKRWKLYPATATRIEGMTWKFPFLDINFFKANETHIWDADVHIFPKLCFPRSMVFPLILRPFLGRQLPAPRDTKAMLSSSYNMEVCQTAPYSHRHELGGYRVDSVPCQNLTAKFPFVHRVPTVTGGCYETLVGNGTVGSWQAFPAWSC